MFNFEDSKLEIETAKQCKVVRANAYVAFITLDEVFGMILSDTMLSACYDFSDEDESVLLPASPPTGILLDI